MQERLLMHLRPLVASAQVPGVVLGYYRRGVQGFVSAGTLSEGDTETPTEHTLYETGSVGKVFTGLLLAEAARRGEVELDTAAVNVAGVPDTASLPATGSFTLRQLATHTSGLPRIPADLDLAQLDPYEGYDRDRLWASLGQAVLASEPGPSFEYSNFGAGLLGVFLECATGLSYEEQIRSRIAVPLGLVATFTHPPESLAERYAPPHEFGVPCAFSGADDALAAAGCLKSTPADTLAFLRHFLHPPATPLGRSLDVAAELHFIVDGEAGGVGLGWHILGDGTRWHNGSTIGFHSFVAFHRELDVAVVVFANDASPKVTDVGFRVLDELVGRQREPIDVRPIVRWAESQMLRFLGAYASSEHDQQLVLWQEDTRIMARLGDQQAYRVFPVSEAELEYRAVDATLRVRVGADSDKVSIDLHQDGSGLTFSRLADETR